MTRTAKITCMVAGVLVAGVVLAFYWFMFMSPFARDALHSAEQKRALQNRTDYPQIAAACITLVRSVRENSSDIEPDDPVVPPLLRSLAPHYISVHNDEVTLEFHGGFDHYGYRVQHAESDDPRQWTIFYYTEEGERLLATISHE